MFTDLAADAVVSGGQTMNPSTEDILAAIQSVPAKTVFVLPLSLIHICFALLGEASPPAIMSSPWNTLPMPSKMTMMP